MVKKLLEEALGVKPLSRGKFRSDFEEFCGMWTESDLEEFEEEVPQEELNQVREAWGLEPVKLPPPNLVRGLLVDDDQ